MKEIFKDGFYFSPDVDLTCRVEK